jgi:hypothetical protein
VPRTAVFSHRCRRPELASGAGAGRSAPIAVCILQCAVSHGWCADFQASSPVELRCKGICVLGTCYNRARQKGKESTKCARLLVDGHVLAMRQARATCQMSYKRVSKPTGDGGRVEAAERVGRWMRHASSRVCTMTCCSTSRNFENALAPVNVKRAARRRQRGRLDANAAVAREAPTHVGWWWRARGAWWDVTFKERSIGETLDPSYRVRSHLFRSQRGQFVFPESRVGRMLRDRGRMFEDFPHTPRAQCPFTQTFHRVPSYMELVE